jgi:regulator of protease activity HflC (stomatin/prohibitin superfamily)
MNNKYLEKIAGAPSASLGRSIANGVGHVAKAVGGVAKDIMHDAGHSVSTALGGGLANAAHKLDTGLSQASLRKATTPGGFAKAVKGVTKSPQERRGLIEGLQKDRNKAIVKSVGYVGGTALAGNKILNKVKENNQQQYYQ